jgi:lipopolysaccharide transport system permease protein
MAFPLELLPAKALAGPLVFGAVSVTLLICYGAWVTHGAILLSYAIGLPLLLALSVLLLTGISLILSCAQVFLRDLKEFVNMFVTIGLFLHPILYLPDAVPAAVRPLVYLSPLSYFIMCWQDVMFYGAIERGWAWAITAVLALLLFMFGARLFLIAKNNFGDFL